MYLSSYEVLGKLDYPILILIPINYIIISFSVTNIFLLHLYKESIKYNLISICYERKYVRAIVTYLGILRIMFGGLKFHFLRTSL